MNMKDEEIFDHYLKIARVLGQMFSPVLEVVVHDLRRPEQSIIAIYNSHITGRKVGDGTSDLGYKRIKGEVPDETVNYENKSPRGNKLKSSTISIRNKKGKLLGALSLNMEVSYFEEISMFLLNIASAKKEKFIEEKEHFYFGSIEKEMESTIKKILLERNLANVPLNKKEKKDTIHYLITSGFFSKRKSISTAARLLQLSRPSVYRYIREFSEDVDINES